MTPADDPNSALFFWLSSLSSLVVFSTLSTFLKLSEINEGVRIVAVVQIPGPGDVLS